MDAVLNVAVPGGGHGSAWYVKGQRRLGKSLDDIGETADRLFFTRWIDRRHQVIPYAFKCDAFLKARAEGYDRAIWFDSSCIVVKPLDGAWELIETQGYLLGLEGWTVGQWCAPEVRELLGRTQEELDAMTLVEGKMMGINFHSDIGNRFLDTWDGYARMGAFNGNHANHRHDITCAGIIASDMGLTLTPHLVEFERKGDPHPDVYVRVNAYA